MATAANEFLAAYQAAYPNCEVTPDGSGVRIVWPDGREAVADPGPEEHPDNLVDATPDWVFACRARGGDGLKNS